MVGRPSFGGVSRAGLAKTELSIALRSQNEMPNHWSPAICYRIDVARGEDVRTGVTAIRWARLHDGLASAPRLENNLYDLKSRNENRKLEIGN